ncbi:MAG: ABC transporter ATP-binding protein [Candidatus Omnitrophica bacterium]|nr:ABC transporter ATP-binding protein [Candidatus Omnitrophota bacterium]MBU4479185.1 ABC transporter ATP-binding protein [Candidatus Omnitrophota bacterium]MCG2704272.1 ABC transporter ATP-binding protein [Candidatus Omnitrophota bacterium]
MYPLLSFQNIVKRYADAEILKGVSLDVREGEIFGLLGPNAAGKTTLIRGLMQLLRINSGEILYDNRPLRGCDIQKHFGFLPENFMAPANLSAFEFLSILRQGLSAPSGVDALLELVGLSGHKHKRVKIFSRGMIQRLGIACALLKNPRVVIFDEPTLGLDPLGQKQVLDILKELNRQGKTIFFSSHILSQMEKACSRVGIIHCGCIRFSGSVAAIIEKHGVLSLEEAFLKEIGAE